MSWQLIRWPGASHTTQPSLSNSSAAMTKRGREKKPSWFPPGRKVGYEYFSKLTNQNTVKIPENNSEPFYASVLLQVIKENKYNEKFSSTHHVRKA